MISQSQFALHACLFSCFILIQATLAASQTRSNDEQMWRAMLHTCVDYATSGRLPDQSGWTRGLVGSDEAEFSHDTLGASITLRPVPDPRGFQSSICEPSLRPLLEGNDAAGLALRAAAHDVLDDRLEFRDRDQIGPSDVWRGCGADGFEFRLLSLTQITNATFWVALSQHDQPCTYLGA